MPVVNDRVTQLFQVMKRQIIELNFFTHVPPSNNENDLRIERYITRLYLILFVVTMAILTAFTSIRPQPTVVIKQSPSLTTFIQLYNQYPLTLSCPCSEAAIKYNHFISYIKPQYHDVCSSDFISSSWINIEFASPFQSVIVIQNLAYQSQFHFQILSTLCRIANQTISESLQSFYQVQLLSTQLPSQESFRFQVESMIDQFIRTVSESYQRTLQWIIMNLEINQFITSVNSKFHGASRIRQSDIVPLRFTTFPFYRGSNCPASLPEGSPCCFPMSFVTCYRPTTFFGIGQRNIAGMFQTWFPLQALLESTLECFYDEECLAQIIELINSTTSSTNFTALKSQPLYHINGSYEKIGSMVNRLFVESWSREISFESYFNQCRPLTCQYTYESRYHLIYVFTTIIGLIGGINTSLRLLAPLIIKIAWRIRNGSTHHRRDGIAVTKKQTSVRPSK